MAKPQNNGKYPNYQNGGGKPIQGQFQTQKPKNYNRRRTLDTTWRPKTQNSSSKSSPNRTNVSGGGVKGQRRRTLNTTWMNHQKSPKSQNWKQNGPKRYSPKKSPKPGSKYSGQNKKVLLTQSITSSLLIQVP